MGVNLVYMLYFRCCEATRFGVHLASIPCHDGTSLRIALKFAMECICRQCADLPKVKGDGDGDGNREQGLGYMGRGARD